MCMGTLGPRRPGEAVEADALFGGFEGEGVVRVSVAPAATRNSSVWAIQSFEDLGRLEHTAPLALIDQTDDGTTRMDNLQCGDAPSFGLILICASIVLLAGAIRDWAILTDPPRWTAFFYSQGLLRLFVSRSGMRWVTGLMGAVFAAFGAQLLIGCFIQFR